MRVRFKSLLNSILQILRNSCARLQSHRDIKIINNFLDDEGITLLDIGAAGGIEPRWEKISQQISYIGFEPDDRLQVTEPTSKFRKYKLIPCAVGRIESEVKFYITAGPGKSSIYLPNTQFIQRFPNPERFNVISENILKVLPIDKLVSEKVNFIKLDIQGGELDALSGATTILESVLGLELEVEFSKIYLNQPIFGDINSFLVEKGFEFIDFINLCRWEQFTYNSVGQLVFGDALFLKSPEHVVNSMNKNDIKKYLAILYIYNRFDLIEKVFSIYSNEEEDFKQFYKQQKNKRKYFYLIVKINRLLSSFYSLFGIEYRSHIIY